MLKSPQAETLPCCRRIHALQTDTILQRYLEASKPILFYSAYSHDDVYSGVGVEEILLNADGQVPGTAV